MSKEAKAVEVDVKEVVHPEEAKPEETRPEGYWSGAAPVPIRSILLQTDGHRLNIQSQLASLFEAKAILAEALARVNATMVEAERAAATPQVPETAPD